MYIKMMYNITKYSNIKQQISTMQKLLITFAPT